MWHGSAGTNLLFAADPAKNKISLGIGAYRDDNNKPLVLQCVREAEKELLADKSVNKEYLAQGGDPKFCTVCSHVDVIVLLSVRENRRRVEVPVACVLNENVLLMLPRA